jgi:hypothetical protein
MSPEGDWYMWCGKYGLQNLYRNQQFLSCISIAIANVVGEGLTDTVCWSSLLWVSQIPLQ